MKIFDSSIKIVTEKTRIKQTDFEKINNIVFSGKRSHRLKIL